MEVRVAGENQIQKSRRLPLVALGLLDTANHNQKEHNKTITELAKYTSCTPVPGPS